MEVVVISGSRADLGPLTPIVNSLSAYLIRLENNSVNKAEEAVNECWRAASLLTSIIEHKSPDFAVVLGDRFEILGAATALYLLSIPIVHLSGGDITEGSQDDSMRHAITKLAHIHFPTHAEAAKRILSMGEESWRVHAVGCPGIDQLQGMSLLSKGQVLNKLGIADPYILVSYQAETLATDPVAEAYCLLDALYRLRLPCVFTTLNPDVGSVGIQDAFERFCARGRGVILDMPQNLYLSAMRYCQVMIGNSSSGLYEAPTLKVPFVNIGHRQSGRPAAKNVCWSPNEPVAICRAVTEVLRLNLRDTVNPYGDGHAAERIRDLLTNKFSRIPRQQLLAKKWCQAPIDP
jgi:UDP-hydrolysing UDP-N-acetyl-D-glucosamine 2-epimerase